MDRAKCSRKCVFVIGPESSGSKLIARVCAHVLGISEFDQWGGGDWCDNGEHKVCHRSLPAGDEQRYPDIDAWIMQNHEDYELYFILTTRDITISELSRFYRFRARSMTSFKQQSADAREIMQSVMDSGQQFMIWSYESFMFLKGGYLSGLYAFLGVESAFLPELIDSNVRRVKRPSALGRVLAKRLGFIRRRFQRPYPSS